MVANFLIALVALTAVGASAIPNKQGNLNRDTKAATDALWKAVGEGDAVGTRTAVSKGADLGELRRIEGSHMVLRQTYTTGTALHLAARLGYVDVAVALIAEGLSVHDKDTGDLWTPLHWAARDGQVDVARVLLAERADIEARDHDTYTPLMVAVDYDKLSVVKTLVVAGADLEAKDSTGQMALHRAAWEDSLYSAMILVEHGANLTAKDNNGKTPLKIAEEYNSTDTAAYLRSVGGQKEETATDALWKAVAEGDVAGIRTAVSKGAHLGELRWIGDDINGTSLHLAARLGYVDVAVALIAEGLSVHDKDTRYLWTPLHLAAWNGQVDVARVLLAERADIEARDNTKRTPLMNAADADRASVVKTLVAAGADLEAEDNLGWRAIHPAAWKDNLYSVMILVEHGADVNAKDINGMTPLWIAEEHNSTDLAAYLRSVGGTT